MNLSAPTIPRLGRQVRRLVRGVRRSLFPSGPSVGLILAYHRVTRLENDPQWLSVTPEHFAEHLDVLCRIAAPVALGELGSCRRATRTSPVHVAITFDDGYADNFQFARPLLERYGVPGTFFVATGHIDQPGEFWWDELESLLLLPGELPCNLECELHGETRWWNLAETGEDGSAPCDGQRTWNVADPQNPTPRHRIYREWCELLRPLPKQERERALQQLRRQAGRAMSNRASHRTMTARELQDLAASGLLDIGAHTVSHPMLSRLSPWEQKLEIEGSLVFLQNILGKPPESFSFPYGTASDYDQASLACVREAGFALACANNQGPVRRTDNAYALPRLLVRDWPGDEFEARLRGWFRD